MLNLKGFPISEEIEGARQGNYPLILAPSTSSICNFRCKPCFTNAGPKQEGEVGLTEHEQAIRQSAKLGARYMHIAMNGEPWLDPAFYGKEKYPMVEIANECGVYTVTFTNSSLITRENAEVAKAMGLSVVGKLWSFECFLDDYLIGSTHSRFDLSETGMSLRQSTSSDETKCGKTKIRCYQPRVEYDGKFIPEGLAILMDAGFNEVEDSRTRLGIDIIVTSANFRGIPEIAEWALEHDIYPVIDTMVPMGRAIDNVDLVMNPQQNKWLFQELSSVLGEDFVIGQFVEGCAIREVGLAYDNFGNTRVCCALASQVGNIKEKSIEELYAGIQGHRRQLATYEKKEGTINMCDISKLVKTIMELD